jgi:hypothetical protein
VRRRSRISLEAMQHSGRKLQRKQSAIFWASIRSFFFFVAAMARYIRGWTTFNAAECGNR